MSINRVAISGNLTRDAELRSSQGGMPILRFSVAVNERRKNNQTGDWEDYPNFVECTLFGSRAEKIAQYLTKGTKAAVEGKLRWSQWEKNGEKRSKLEVIVDEIEFMSRNQGGGQKYAQPAPAYAAPAPAPAPAPVPAPATIPMSGQQVQMQPAPAAAPSIYDENIPF